MPARSAQSLLALTTGLWRSILLRAAAFALAWWAIAEGRPVSWYFAVTGIAAATAVSIALWPPGRWRLLGVLRFVPYFVVGSMKGGVDVALRALLPGATVHPGFIEHRFRHDDPAVQLLVVNVVSLLPGTLAARLETGAVVVHVLDQSIPAVTLATELESRVSEMTSAPSRSI